MNQGFPAQDWHGPQTREISSPVETRYESLNVEATRKAYSELNAALEGLAGTIVHTMKQIVPYLAEMQSLLSQRGDRRKSVLKKAGLPTWSKWAANYAERLDCTVRTIQLHIKYLREGRVCHTSAQPAAGKRVNGSGGPKPEPDWKVALANLVSALKPCGDTLPNLAKDAVHAAEALLERGNDTDSVSPNLSACPPAAISGDAASGEPVGRYWLTPRDIYDALNGEFSFDDDPTPFPRPAGFDSLNVEWGKSSYVNPPFHKWDGGGNGPTAWARKAIEENRKGKQVVLLLPVQSYVNLLLEAGAEVRSAGRVRWLEADTGQPCSSPSPIACFILRPKQARALKFPPSRSSVSGTRLGGYAAGGLISARGRTSR